MQANTPNGGVRLVLLVVVVCLNLQTVIAQTSMSEGDKYEIKLIVGQEELSATLNKSNATRDFVEMLPLNLTLRDYAQTEKVSDLPEKLNTENSPSGSDASAGDIAYYAPWGNLAIFYKDFKYAKGLVILGQIKGDLSPLTASETVVVRIKLKE